MQDITQHQELWKEIPIPFDSSKNITISRTNKYKYYISSGGQVKRCDNFFLKSVKDKFGRKGFRIPNHGYISTLRLMAFVFKPDEVKKFEDAGIKWHADHIDNDFTNDNINNLQILSASENTIKSNRQVNRKTLFINNKKVVLQYDLNGSFIKEWESAEKAAKELKLSKSCISYCCRAKSKMSGNFIWKYKDDNLKNEIWNDCKLEQFKGYKWSNMGRICDKINRKSYGYLSPHGYFITNINSLSMKVHRLIALENDHDGYFECQKRCKQGENPHVDHIDRNKKNNRPENLRWVTRKENMENWSVDTEIPVECIDIKTGEIIQYKTLRKAAIISNTNRRCIRDCTSGKRLQAKGKIWKVTGDTSRNLVELRINFTQNRKHRNIKNKEFQRKGVTAINIKTGEIKTFESIRETSIQTKFWVGGIINCCKKFQLTCKGYIFRYTLDPESKNIEKLRNNYLKNI